MAPDTDDREELFVVTYTGPFGYIKPWTAVRDELTYSQPFLTQSIVEGMRQKLEVEAILRHRLSHGGLSVQQERTHTAGWKQNRTSLSRPQSILKRGVMVCPVLSLLFASRDEAIKANSQHLCLCRNEDLLLPIGFGPTTMDQFEAITGCELLFEQGDESFLVGYNRFADLQPMHGRLLIVEGDTAS